MPGTGTIDFILTRSVCKFQGDNGIAAEGLLSTRFPRALGAGANFGGFQRGRSNFHVAPFAQGRGQYPARKVPFIPNP